MSEALNHQKQTINSPRKIPSDPTNRVPSGNRHSLSKMTRNRLPTLQEVLARQTRPPVDLYCFYLYLQRERAEDSLDFWLDAQQHENICRAYFKDLRRSAVDLKEEWPSYYERAKARGSVYNNVNGITRQSRLINDTQDRGMNEKAVGTSSGGGGGRRSESSNHRRSGPSPSTLPSHISPAVRALFPHDQSGNASIKEANRTSSRVSVPPRSRTPIQPVIPRSAAITRTDLIASAERIYYRYLLTGAEKEIYLPSRLRIHDFPINSSSLPNAGREDYEVESEFMAQVPDLFVAQKEYIYRSMEQDTFPRFLRSKAFGNLTPLSSLVRLSLGLLAIWIGLSLGLSLIFLDHKPQAERSWVLLPLTVGSIGVIGYLYDLDPIFIGFNRSETMPFRTLSIKERYVQKILRGRAIWVMIISLVLAVLTSAILVLVPGYRL
ncbi:RGS domain-containing protein [Phakopsora pachyrhizi]|nr:RGS domain-containing protein [Phakopsora pachyrhizi]